MMSALRRVVFVTVLVIAGVGQAHADPLSRMLAVERARPPAPRIDRARFMPEPQIASATLAPDGLTVAFVRIVGEQRSLWLQSTAAGAPPRRFLQRIGAGRIAWSADSRWLFLIDAAEIRMISIAGMPGSGVVTRLGGATGMRLLGLDPWRPSALLVDRSGGRWRLWRTGPGGGKRLVAYDRREILDVAVDRAGRPSFVRVAAGERQLIVARTGEGRFRAVAACTHMVRCDLLGVTPDRSGVYLASDLLGSRRAVLRLGIDGRPMSIHDDPGKTVDVDGVTFDRIAGMPMLARYRGSRTESYGLTPEARAGLARLRLSSDAEIETSSRTWFIREQGAQIQGSRWHLFDPATGRRRLLLDDQPRRLSEATLARVIPFAYPASDGMAIRGLLSVPPGRDPARTPLVTLVHGGPWGRDEIEYSALVQLLANRGYAVFQPQFRGSTGYGRDYMFAADGDFGDGRVQRDIEDGTRYLLARGIGDPGRTAIMGASFGGYSTLQALSNGSRLYRAGIAIVPPTDFGWSTRWAATRIELGANQGMTSASILKLLALDVSDPSIAIRLHRQSPSARVAAMRTPLLLIAAGRDDRVPIRSVIDYAAHLKSLGAPADIVVSRKQGHSSKDRTAALASLYLVETMFRRHLGGPQVAAPTPAEARWMLTNLKRI
jgi:dipeptidyl aminopeptidase/acylaminoacyl peptidase